MLRQQGFRRVWAGAMREAAQVYDRCGIERASLTTDFVVLLQLLDLPDKDYVAVMKQNSPTFFEGTAESSMLQDLNRGRATEIDQLSGEIVRLAQQIGETATVNAKLVQLIKYAEATGSGSPAMSSIQLAAILGQSQL